MRKGDRTKAHILETALERAVSVGLHGLTIGELARDLALSKSGLFAHFHSKEKLQLEVLATAAERFIDEVVRPAIAQPRGEPRVRALFENWMKWAHTGDAAGCIFAASTFELANRPGALRDYLAQTQDAWLATLGRAAQLAIEAGDFREDLDTEQFAFEMEGLFLSSQHGRMLGKPDIEARTRRGFEALLARARRVS